MMKAESGWVKKCREEDREQLKGFVIAIIGMFVFLFPLGWAISILILNHYSPTYESGSGVWFCLASMVIVYGGFGYINLCKRA
jgi:uncharacterized membrane protein